MRYLGLDLGTRTCGIAISDLTHTIASPYKVLHFSDSDYESILPIIKNIVDEEKISKIVLGLPKNMNNTMGDRCDTTIAFKDMLEQHVNIEIVLQDERLSTVAAHNYMLEADLSRKKRKAKVDGLAANIILQTYIDIERGKNNGN